MTAAAETPQALNSAGMRALAESDPAIAAVLFARATALDPAAVPLWINLAKAQRLTGDEAGERASLEAALAIDATHLMALIRLAELHERTGEPAKAMLAWVKAIAMAPPAAERGEALHALLTRAEAFVAERSGMLGDAVDAALADTRAAHGPAALRRINAAIDVTLGRRRVYVNECAGLHVPFLPADEFFPRDHFPWMTELESQTGAIAAEIADLLAHGDDGFAPYVSMEPGLPPNKWSELDNSARWSAYYIWKYGEPVAAAHRRCPATVKALSAIPRAELPGRAPTAFFSILHPRTHIPPHTGVSNSRTIIHLPLIVPPGCWFRVGGETRAWEVGKAFAFDDTIDHEAMNGSDEVRAVLIFDVWNPHLTGTERTVLQDFYRAADASGHNPEPRG